MRAYLATPLFTPHQRFVLNEMKDMIEQIGYDVFSPLHASQDIWKGRAPADCTSAERKEVVRQNAVNVGTSDLVVAWIGGWDPAKTILDRILGNIAHPTSGGTYADDGNVVDAVRRFSPPLPDVGVTWELGYAHASEVPVLAYLDDSDQDRNFNLMISETCQGVAKGRDKLRSQLLRFYETQTLEDGFLLSEPEEVKA